MAPLREGVERTVRAVEAAGVRRLPAQSCVAECLAQNGFAMTAPAAMDIEGKQEPPKPIWLIFTGLMLAMGTGSLPGLPP